MAVFVIIFICCALFYVVVMLTNDPCLAQVTGCIYSKIKGDGLMFGLPDNVVDIIAAFGLIALALTLMWYGLQIARGMSQAYQIEVYFRDCARQAEEEAKREHNDQT